MKEDGRYRLGVNSNCHRENAEHQSPCVLKFEDVGAKVVDVNHIRLVTPEENQAALGRIDILVIPHLFISYGPQFIGKGLLGNTAQFSVIEDLHLCQTTVANGVEETSIMTFSDITLIFYWGFDAMPSRFH